MRKTVPNNTESPNKGKAQKSKDTVLPTAQEMRKFARGITPYQWGILITSPDFVKAVEVDLNKAALIFSKYFPKISP